MCDRTLYNWVQIAENIVRLVLFEFPSVDCNNDNNKPAPHLPN